MREWRKNNSDRGGGAGDSRSSPLTVSGGFPGPTERGGGEGRRLGGEGDTRERSLGTLGKSKVVRDRTFSCIVGLTVSCLTLSCGPRSIFVWTREATRAEEHKENENCVMSPFWLFLVRPTTPTLTRALTLLSPTSPLPPLTFLLLPPPPSPNLPLTFP